MKNYVVFVKDIAYDDGEYYAFVKADSEEEAYEKAIINKLIDNERFLEDVYIKSIGKGNLYFSEYLFETEIGHYSDFWNGKREEFLERFGNENKVEEYFMKSFEMNCKNFFGHHRDFAETYLNHWLREEYNGINENGDFTLPKEEYKFSRDMLAYIFKKIEKDWSVKEIQIIE